MKNIISGFFFFLVLLFCASCNNEVKEKIIVNEEKKDSVLVLPLLVQAPVPKLNPPMELAEIDAENGGDIQIKNSKGSVVSVPKNCLVDSLRHPISGKVKISYREFHDVAGIFLSGIPMDYDAAGMIKRFETAGMFELRAEQNGRQVYVDSGKTIRVNFAGRITGSDYHLFYLDETLTRNWHFVGDEKGLANPEKRNLLGNRRENNLKIPLGKEYFTFNYMAALDVFYNDNEKLIEQNRNNPATRTKISEYGLTHTNIYNYQRIDFEGKKMMASMLIWKNISGKTFPAWSAKSESVLTPLGGNEYEVKIDDKSGNIFTAKIEAFMPIKSLFAFTAQEWQANYDKNMRKIREDEARIAKLADVYRTMEINKFGIYNYDRYLNDENALTINADFKFDRDPGVMKNIEICYVSGSNRSLVKFPYDKWNEFILLPDKNAKLFALIADNYLAVYDVQSYRKIDFKKLKEMNAPSMVFELKSIRKLESEKDLKEVLGVN